MTYKLCRFFNIFNPKVYKWLVTVTVAYTVMFAIVYFSNRSAIITVAIAETVSIVIFCINLLLHCPKALSVCDGNIEFIDYVNMRPRYLRTRGFWWLKVSYSVSDVRNLQFHQNFIEKHFDMGHISFSGRVQISAKRDVDRIKERDVYVIYGIRNFSLFALDLQNKLKQLDR